MTIATHPNNTNRLCPQIGISIALHPCCVCIILNQTLLFHIVATLNSLPHITVSFQIFPAFSSSEEEKLNCFQLRFSVFAINVFSQRAFICGFNEIAHHRWKTANPDVKKQQIRTRHSEEERPVVGDTEQNPRRLIFQLTRLGLGA